MFPRLLHYSPWHTTTNPTRCPGAATGVALAILLPHGKQAALAAGSLIGMRVDRDVTFSVPPDTK
jgi:hypothetical protein